MHFLSPNQQVNRSNEHWANDNQAAHSLSTHSSSTSASPAIQQSGPSFPVASFNALESIQPSAGDQQQAISAFPFSLLSPDPTLLSAAHSTPYSTLSLPSGLQSIAMTSRASSQDWHVDDSAIFSGQSASPAMTKDDLADRVITHVTALVNDVRREQAPSLPSTSPEILAATKATNLLSSISGFSEDEKVRLRRYFCNNIVEAGSLPEHDLPYLTAIFQDTLRELNKSNQ
jgi:hypothetical protein